MAKPLLDGVKVVEWSIYVMGPLAGVMLRDLGAEVIKIEDPSTGGETLRGLRYTNGTFDAQMPGGRNASFEISNWGKRSVGLNLKSPEGLELAMQLIEKADVFLTNFRPPVVERIGLDYEAVRKRNPQIIYAAASAFGPQGPLAGRPGNDYTGQARSGMMWGPGTDEDPPLYHTGAPCDIGGSTLLSHGITTALYARERTGKGQMIDVSNLGAGMWFQYWAVGINSLVGQRWPRMDRRKPGNALWNHYPCGDGEWLALANLLPENWPPFCRVMGLDHLMEDERFLDIDARRRNAQELVEFLDAHFQTRPRADWEAILEREPSLAFERVQRVEDLAHDDQVLANDYITEIDHPVYGKTKVQNFPMTFEKNPLAERQPAPDFGEHTFEVLTEELGLSPEQISEYLAAGVAG